MILEVILIFPLYAGIFILIFRFRRIIKAMTELNEIFFAMPSEGDDRLTAQHDPVGHEVTRSACRLSKVEKREEVALAALLFGRQSHHTFLTNFSPVTVSTLGRVGR